MSNTALQIPDCLLLIATGCTHCPVVLEHLGRLVKEGAIGRLEVVNVGQRPEVAADYGVRQVPWYRIGNLELTGARGLDELRSLVAEVGNGQGSLRQLEEYLAGHELDAAIKLIGQQPALLGQLIAWLGDLEKPFDLRIGIGALLEGLPDSLRNLVRTPLEALLQSALPQVRADACHYLGISGQRASIPLITALLEDADASVREIASETLELFQDSMP